MPNLSALAPITTAATALSNLVLVSPQATQGYQPQNPPNKDGTPSTKAQPPSFLFHYEGEQVLRLKSDITDHFVENNTAIQDQIALKPETFTTNGFIGELNDVVPDFLKPVKFLADKLTTIGPYTPQLTTTALLAYSEAFFLYQVASNTLDSAIAAWSSISGLINGGGSQAVIGAEGLTAASSPQNKQQTAFQQFYGYWRNRTLFTIQTPWAVFQNMAIDEVNSVQDETDKLSTTFTVTFKMIRMAQTQSLLGGISALFQQRSGAQASGLTDLGSSTPSQGPSLGSVLA